MIRMLPVLFALTLAPACNRGGSQPPDAPASEVPAGFEGAPEGAAGIAALLGARHTEDRERVGGGDVVHDRLATR